MSSELLPKYEEPPSWSESKGVTLEAGAVGKAEPRVLRFAALISLLLTTVKLLITSLKEINFGEVIVEAEQVMLRLAALLLLALTIAKLVADKVKDFLG